MRGDFGKAIAEYKKQAQAAALQETARTPSAKLAPPAPDDLQLHWLKDIRTPLGDGTTTALTLCQLYISAITNSSQIKAFSDIPLVRETGIQEATGVFDPRLFAETKYEHADDPVGNTLTTGGPSRFRQDDAFFEAGLKKKFAPGTDVRASGKIGHTNNNSVYFRPSRQGSGRINLAIVQPLLQGGGIAYNRGVLQVAEIDSQIASREFARQAESHLLEVTRTYWNLFMSRGIYLQKKAQMAEVEKLVDGIEARGGLDARRSQLLRARSALADRRADMIRTEAAIRNSQDRLRALVNDPALTEYMVDELVPTDVPVVRVSDAEIMQSVATALTNRSEIDQGFSQLRAAAIREKMQRNEVLPRLNLMLDGYLAGLNRGDWGHTTNNGFFTGNPGYGAGLSFELPLGNNTAEARLTRRQIELRQQFEQLKTTIETVLLEVKVTVREVKTSYRDLQAKSKSVTATQQELDELIARRELAMGSDSISATSYLDMIINAQDRLLRAQEDYLRSLGTYNVALLTLERAKGNLLNFQRISMVRSTDTAKDLPVLKLDKSAECADPFAAAAADDLVVPLDSDQDGVPDSQDLCPGTPAGAVVDRLGCVVDSDKDGVPDAVDKCPGTPAGNSVDARGCLADADKDGVPDALDKCPGTSAGSAVDGAGCLADADKDGVPDALDKCPGTPAGGVVDARGCLPEVDTDGDGVFDAKDQCPGTPAGDAVTSMGCPKEKRVDIQLEIVFDTAKWDIKPEFDPQLKKVAEFLQAYPDAAAVIEGHTDNMGNDAANIVLSQRRADSVREALISRFGVDGARLSAKGYGPIRPTADNATREGRQKNRRVVATFSTK